MYRAGIYLIVGNTGPPENMPRLVEVTLGYFLTEAWGNWVAETAHKALGPGRSWGWFVYNMGPPSTPSYPTP